MSQMSDLVEPALDRSVSWTAVVDAVDLQLRGDENGARASLADGGDAVGWDAIGHHLAVTGRGLVTDASLFADVTDLVALEACVSTAVVDFDSAWSALSAVATLIDRAGFPAEVVI